MSVEYLMRAVNLYDSINIRLLRPLLSGKVVDISSQDLIVQRDENSYIFAYRFGAVIFFNVSEKDADLEMLKMKTAIGPELSAPVWESFLIRVGEGSNAVEFEHVTLKKLTQDHLKIIALTVGQSVSLEYYESLSDQMLTQSGNLVRRVSEVGSVPLGNRPLLKMIGSAASTRQRIITNLAILDPPDVTWKGKEYEKLFQDMQLNFEVDIRFKTLDRKLALIQNHIEILINLNTSRRGVLLESMIVLLIIFEIVMALWNVTH